MKHRLEAEIIRKYRQRMRIYEMYLLCKAYEMYHMMQLHAECARQTLSYEEAENFSSFMNEVFKVETNASTFISDKNEETDKSLAYYDKFQDVLKGMDDEMKAPILSFCKSVYFGQDCMSLKIDGFMLYPVYLEALIKYVSGFGTLTDVRNAIIDFKPWYDKPRKTDSRKFRRDFIKIEQLYSDIAIKVRERKKKRV